MSPNNTFKAIADLESEWLRDLPSQQARSAVLVQCERVRCSRRELVPGVPASNPGRMLHAELPRRSHLAVDLLR